MAVRKIQPTEKVLNGVDTEVVQNAVKALTNDPELAEFRFNTHNKWISGGHNHSVITDFYGTKQTIKHERTFETDADEPPALAGSDKGANPVEHLLNALAFCVTTTTVYHAALRGIKIDELETELEGDLDLRGFLGITNEVRRGYSNIRIKFRVKTDEQNLDKLKSLAKLSPVFDVTSNGTNIDMEIERM